MSAWQEAGVPREFKRDLVLECRGNHIIVNADPGRSIPPVTLSVFIDHAHVMTHLTADEAAILGKHLLDAATRSITPAAAYPDGTTDTTTRALDTFADLAATPADPGAER